MKLQSLEMFVPPPQFHQQLVSPQQVALLQDTKPQRPRTSRQRPQSSYARKPEAAQKVNIEVPKQETQEILFINDEQPSQEQR